MAFTGRLGTSTSQLGQIELGSGGASTVSASFTADAFIQLYFRADAVIKVAQSASFTADAVINAGTVSASFTADAVVKSTISRTFTADAYLVGTITTSFTANAVIKKSQSTSFTADAVKRKGQTASFTANALKRNVVSRSFTANAYIPSFRMRHARTGPHTGLDRDLDHIIAWAFDRYLRGESLQEVLIDIDARLTARERGLLAQRRLLPSNAIVKASMSTSALMDAYIAIRYFASFTSNAVLMPVFLADAIMRRERLDSLTADAEILKAALRANSWISHPSVFINDSIAGASDWGISAVRKGAAKNTSTLSHEAGDPSNWFFTQDKTGWAKFVLGSTTTVHLDTVGSQGNMQIDLFGPGSSPTNGNGLTFGDDTEVDLTNPWGYSETIEITLGAGTYFVAVALLDFNDPDAIVQLNMQTI